MSLDHTLLCASAHPLHSGLILSVLPPAERSQVGELKTSTPPNILGEVV